MVDAVSDFSVGSDNYLYYVGGGYSTPAGIYKLDIESIIDNHLKVSHSTSFPFLPFLFSTLLSLV